MTREVVRSFPNCGYAYISGVIHFSLMELCQGSLAPVWHVIDISGGSANNQGRLVTLSRGEAAA